MISFVKEGIEQIKDTKKYAREKNVMTWIQDMVIGIFLTFMLIQIAILEWVIYMMPVLVNFDSKLAYVLAGLPFILSTLFILKYGKYPIKLMILKSYYMNKATFKLINKLDMYLWQKTGKDSLATQYVVKYRLPVQMIFYAPLFLIYLI